MTNKKLLIAFILITILSFSSLFCEENHKLEGKVKTATSSSDVLIQVFSYLNEQPVAKLKRNMSGFISTEDISVLAAILKGAKKKDFVFFDYDGVLVTYNKTNQAWIPVDDAPLIQIFKNTKENSNVYILSTGDNLSFHTSLGLVGTEIDVKPDLIIPKDLQGLHKTHVIPLEECANQYSIDFCNNNTKNKKLIFSIYPELGSFQVGRPYWCHEWDASDIPHSVIETKLNLASLPERGYPFFQYLYAKSPIKGKIMRSILSILRQNMNEFIPQNIYFIDNSLLNCKAFLHYVKELKNSGFYTGNVKVIHFNKIKKDPQDPEPKISNILEALDRLKSNKERVNQSCQNLKTPESKKRKRN